MKDLYDVRNEEHKGKRFVEFKDKRAKDTLFSDQNTNPKATWPFSYRVIEYTTTSGSNRRRVCKETISYEVLICPLPNGLLVRGLTGGASKKVILHQESISKYVQIFSIQSVYSCVLSDIFGKSENMNKQYS